MTNAETNKIRIGDIVTFQHQEAMFVWVQQQVSNSEMKVEVTKMQVQETEVGDIFITKLGRLCLTIKGNVENQYVILRSPPDTFDTISSVYGLSPEISITKIGTIKDLFPPAENIMTPRQAKVILKKCFAALPKADQTRLAHHAQAGTTILCGKKASWWTDGTGGG